MELAVLELGDLDLDAAGGFLGLFFHRVEFLAQLLVVDDARFELAGTLAVFVQEIDDGLAGLVDDPAADIVVAELVLGLRFEDRVLDLDRHRAEGAVADVYGVEALLVEFVDALEHALAEGALVGAAIGGVLAVDEGAVGFAVAVDVGKGEFEVLALVVGRRVDSGFAGRGLEQVEQAVFRLEFLLVAVEPQAAV